MVTAQPHEPWCVDIDKTIYGAHKCTALSNQMQYEVMELRSGDVLYHEVLGKFMFIARSAHPVWPSLQAVVWCSESGELSIDALSHHQVVVGRMMNRDETPEQRGARFRQWYLERGKNAK